MLPVRHSLGVLPRLLLRQLRRRLGLRLILVLQLLQLAQLVHALLLRGLLDLLQTSAVINSAQECWAEHEMCTARMRTYAHTSMNAQRRNGQRTVHKAAERCRCC